MSLASIASTAFKGEGESIVAECDRRHISRQTGLNAYIKSESFAGTETISYPGVRSTYVGHGQPTRRNRGRAVVVLCRSDNVSRDIDVLL